MPNMTYPSERQLRFLEAEMKLRGITQTELAKRIGRNQSMVSMVFARKKIARPTLIKMQEVISNTPKIPRPNKRVKSNKVIPK